MYKKRVPLRVVFLSVGLVFVATALIFQYFLSGQPIFSMPRSDEFQQSFSAVETEVEMRGTEGFSTGNLETLSGTFSEENLHSTSSPQSGDSFLLPETAQFEIIQLIIPELEIDASVGSVHLVPRDEGGSQARDSEAALGRSPGQLLQINPSDEKDHLDVNSQYNVKIDVIREMLGLDASAQFTVYNLSNNYLIDDARMESYSGNQPPIVILLDNARWIIPEDGMRFQIATSWPDKTGLSRFVIVAKPREITTHAENLN